MKKRLVVLAVLAGIALLAMQSLSVGAIALALLAAWAALEISERVERSSSREPEIRLSVVAGLWLTASSVFAVLAACVRMCAVMLGPRRAMVSRIVTVPLDLRSPVSIALFANIITLTPGTLSVEREEEGPARLRVHCLGVRDEAVFVAKLKRGLEKDVRRFLEGGS